MWKQKQNRRQEFCMMTSTGDCVNSEIFANLKVSPSLLHLLSSYFEKREVFSLSSPHNDNNGKDDANNSWRSLSSTGLSILKSEPPQWVRHLQEPVGVGCFVDHAAPEGRGLGLLILFTY